MKISGEKGAVYIGSVIAPQRSNWSIDVSRELREARVFSNVSGGSWVEQGSGFMSWSGSADGYYDDSSSTSIFTAVLGATAEQPMLFYENRLGAGSLHYWYGTAWIDVSENASVDGFVELNMSITGSGALQRVG
jgi:hypothetical protein